MDIYDTQVLVRVVPSLLQPSSFLLDTFFPEVSIQDEEKISFDVETNKRRISPFVSPIVQGKVVSSRGYVTKTFEPAYIKDKRMFDPNKPLRRAIGERIGGGDIAPAQREQANLNFEMEDQITMLVRRLELMAADALLDGKTVVTGEGYDTVEVDFGRDAALTVQLLTTARWGEAGVSPAQDLEDWATLVMQKSGAAPIDIVFTPDAWKLALADPLIKDALDVRRGGGSTIELGAQVAIGGVFKGVWGNFRLWVYNDWYIDDAGVEQPILPAHTVIMGSAAIEGVRYFGAIRDPELGYQAMPFAPKSWTEKDPAVRWLMMQSAPLPVPHRVDASFVATVR